mmetsp:Transcript_28198/g.60071  ORF Transcript_28198/g.60071 Transcript_28198/m.60071 type:complete len:842 (+) Transcript_28198:112-2637(+)|eukprot:CAMPEP_0172314862 /NCGR_PEP_ID=MMETSP1058-20130122/23376_1 /TAXON_ID=83371 /ORGANISM="Detonula confervacea, Strain CCMP 353" /LENGTH=841 /DNA_ID=CAMNT_0013028811 /DNA_START=106 /DNA_END=2631 /DNA_ORIENTATION=-
MANGENRAKIKQSAGKTAEGIKKMTLGVGRGITGFASGTIDAIVNPHTIPEKIETCFDTVFVQPTRRTVDFIDETSHKVMTETDRAFTDRVKQAQDGARHLKVVFAQPLQDLTGGSFMAKKYPKSDVDNALIDAALNGNFVFDDLSASKRANLVGAFEPVIVKHGTKIIDEGDVGDYFYVVGSGNVGFEISGKEVGTAGKGSSFGELALLYQAPRAATCIAKTQCGLFRLDQETFRRIMAQQIHDSHAEVIGILKTVPYFKDLDEAYLNTISNNLKVINFKDGDVLASRQEDSEKRFYIVKEGNVEITGLKGGGSEYKDITLGPGKFFGEMAIMENTWALGAAKAKGQVVVLALERDQFVRVLGGDMRALLKKTADKNKLALIPFGTRKNPADDNELDLLAGAIEEKKFLKGHVFFTEGKRCIPALYLIRQGKVSIRSSNHPSLETLLGFSLGQGDQKTIGGNGYFGNDTMGANEKGEFGLSQYTVIALEDVEAGVLDFDAIKSVVAAKDKKEGEKITMDDLDMIRILGAGTFGKVWLVSHNNSKDAYALKIQVKKQLIEFNQAEGVIREKNIMAKLDHPFIIKMVSHWKDDDKLYMLLKLYQGGELQTVIHTDSRDGIPEWAAKFYAANMLEGLSFMHNRHIIYRDLKPENVLLDSDGYTVIVDLGFAKIIRDKTYTFCGTPLYLAPEIITQKGHNKGADHWSWGVMLYEMIVGMTPFYDGIVDQMGLFKNIVKCRMEFPEGDFMSAASKDLITKMLTVNPNDRLGSFAGAEKDIKKHEFFDGMDWVNLCKKNVKVPFKPKVSDPLDGSNFDDFSKLEAKTKREKMTKLTGVEQKLFARF